MSWQMASVALLALALAGGFAWYERSRPPSRVLALVAALAALAVVGRIAFAPLPNVKPATTDVVLFAGLALGGAPGFATGAVAALISNFFFEQGAWTPWQMAAWALVGVGGAGLARVAGRELGRWPLAIACGLAGLAFGAVMDTYQWTLAAHQDAATWLVVAGTSLPYNLAHAIGNFVFALALGPAFVRALSRYRRRFEVRWRAPAVGAACVAAVAGVAALAIAPRPAGASLTGSALSYLRHAQNSDGGFGPVPGSSSNQLYTGWAALGMAAGGRSPNEPGGGGRSAIDYMRARAGSLNDIGELERTILVLRAGAVSARSFAGRDLVAELTKHQRGDGSWERLVDHTAFGILALRSAGVSGGAVKRASSWLRKQQNSDGGFGFAAHSASDVDDTGAALQAMAVAGSTGKRAKRGVKFLRRSQNGDGGFGQYADAASNSQSTAWAAQGLVAVGRSPDALKKHGRTPLSYLRSMRRSNGSIRYSRHSNQTPVWVTGQAIVALAHKSFPLRPVKARHKSVVAAGRRGGAAGRKSSNDGGADAGGKDGAGSAGPADRGVEPVPRPTAAAAVRRASQRIGRDGESGPPAALILALSGAGLLVLGGGSWWRTKRHPRDA